MDTIYTILDAILPVSWLQANFMKNAFLAILLASPLFGILGTFVVTNKMAFFSDAIGHSALTGIAIGILLEIQNPLIAMILFSLVLGFSIIWVKTKDSASTDTIIGIFSSTASALGIVLLSKGGSFAKYSRYLVGDLLSITSNDILLLAISNILIITIWCFFYNKMLLVSINSSLAKSRGIKTFWLEQIFAATTAAIVTMSIQWTGLLVINSLLVLPASAAKNISKSSRSYLFLSIGISLIASISGLALAFYFGTAAGATIVLVATLFYVLTLFKK